MEVQTVNLINYPSPKSNNTSSIMMNKRSKDDLEERRNPRPMMQKQNEEQIPLQGGIQSYQTKEG